MAKALELRPGLILMDIQLPKISGLEAIRRLRAEAATTATPIIAITSFALSGDEHKAKPPAPLRLSRQALQPVRFAEAHTAALAET